MDVSRGVGVVEKMWMCGYRPWGGSCGENVYVGSGVDDVEKTWLCGCGQQSDYCGENMDVLMWAVK